MGDRTVRDCPVIHLAIDAARDHLVTAAVATANAGVALAIGAVTVLGAEVNDGLLTGAVLFILATGTGIAGWSLVLLVRLSQVVSRLEGDRDDFERRLSRLETHV